MNFESKILENAIIYDNYFNGEFNFTFLKNPICIQYAITNTVEHRILGEKKTNRLEKFTELEGLFFQLIDFLDNTKYDHYKDIIAQKLSDESLIYWENEAKKTEKHRLSKEIYLDDICIEWRKDFWDIEKDEIIYKERFEIGLGFFDPKKENEYSISVELNPINFEIEKAYFE